ncbi:bifunctional metallophosphatase/5'-nucleotidase [[Mycoplasma] collis]|uniref:bifunctional metallophosphatase/5'-nucleotidase n=1 Tax=[Mycoplasma] collis TaxID=2127 RepID=UPI00051BD3EF|nr:bifunctional UDP-sugar hydrolase/5'-nucleotidase [[Mycoplasma] collis]
MKKLKKLSFLLLGSAVTASALTVVACSSNKVFSYNELSEKLFNDKAETLRNEYFDILKKYNESIETFGKEFDKNLEELEKYQDELKKLVDTQEKTKKAKSKNTEADQKIKEFETKYNTIETNLLEELRKLNYIVKPYEKRLNNLLSQLRVVEENNRYKTIRLFHTNDEHGRLLTDFGRFNKYSGMEGINNFLSNKEFDLLLSSGDLIQGLPLNDSDKGETISKVAKAIYYDSVAVGNHEFDFDLPQILKLNGANSKKEFDNSLENEGGTPFISANIYYNENAGADKNGKRVFKPYKIKTLENGLRVAIIGITTPDTVYTSHPDHSKNVEFKDPKESVENAIKELEEKEKDVTFYIASVHLGTQRNKAEWSSEALLGVKKLALILDGHSHTYVPLGIGDDLKLQEKKNLTQTESYTKFLGDISLVWDNQEKKIVKIHQSLRDINQVVHSQNKYVDLLIKKLKDKFDKENDVVVIQNLEKDFAHIGKTKIPGSEIEFNTGRVMATELGVLASDALGYAFNKVYESNKMSENFKDMAPSLDNTIVLSNAGGLRANLSKGKVTKADLLAISPYGNRIKAAKVKGSVIIKAFENSASKGTEGAFAQWSSNVSYKMTVTKVTEPNANSGLPFKYTLDEASIKINDKAIDKEKYYYLVSNDFVFVGGDNYKMLDLQKADVNNVKEVYEGGLLIEEIIKFINDMSSDQKETNKAKLFGKLISEYKLDEIKKKQIVELPTETNQK